MLKDKKVVLGVTGGIAAYKAAELARFLIREGASVKVIMTESATRFITPLTFQTLTNNPVAVDMFEEPVAWEIEHISLAKWADVFLIAPATANIIGKIASGIADDILTTTVMATKAPVVIAPAMNVNMYNNPITQRNIDLLRQYGYYFVQPESGELACGDIGQGRLADISSIVDFVKSLFVKKDLVGRKILVTAGPTREPIDPVRYISNYSSGKMGYALAKAARDRGAEVILISGPTSIDPPIGVMFERVSTAEQMRDKVLQYFDEVDAVIMSAAVADYRPMNYSNVKIKKDDSEMTIRLSKNPDILKELGDKKGRQVLIGFAAETDNIVMNASKKIKEKNLDMIVINDVTQPGAGFEVDTNIVKIITKDGDIKDFPLMNKYDLSHAILDLAANLMVR
ncbi:Phosphopantothenate-cysteine ligase [Caldanaerobius fijiensis DSM 17918]|uniref:Coenzyme A biosynthesis bifunctional protein CoaBC n=2 Tax=Caldanaerobius TaxID=862261 RepID=A0A1M4ZQP7_9THEO|nr:bifunctional phosphopantothenoylcysteine decarboxylase/phosphopantothenate--cysteine ligase CoaBC [Caldanaerobius fijiensis]SHF20122.1 Phosphopantothenate-cysteine ligase [Caldanaerobius fijiensis DSM 17918]